MKSFTCVSRFIGILLLLYLGVQYANSQTTIFFEDFGNDINRVICPYTPTGTDCFIFADPNTTDDPTTTGGNYNSNENLYANEIENNYYAVISPKRIYPTYASGYNPEYHYQLWLNAIINDHTPGDSLGAVLAVNAGTTLNSFYKRQVYLTAGKYYKVSLYTYVVNHPMGISLNIMSASGNSTLATLATVEKYSNSTSWELIEGNFYLPTCSSSGNFYISLENNKAENQGNDWYIDDIKFEELASVPASFATISCNTNEPTANNDTSTGNTLGYAVTVSLLSNDKLGDGETDATKDNVTLTVLIPEGAVKDQWSNKITVFGEGEWTYTNQAITFTPASGFTGNPTPITYTITETSTGLTSPPATVTVTYNGTPTANDDNVSANMGTTVNINILSNDKKSDGTTTPTYSDVTVKLYDTYGSYDADGTFTTPGEGTWTYSASTGVLTFVPVSGFSGTPTPITYTITEGTAVSAPAEVSITVNTACAWKSVSGGNWTNNSNWEYLDCTTGTWIPSPVAPNNSRPIYIKTNISIPASTNISADSLYIKPNGILTVNTTSTLNVTHQIIFGIDKDGNTGQLITDNNCNNVTTTSAKIIVRKALDSEWDFISFPFNVPAANVYLAGTNTRATWGNIKTATPNSSFFAAQYNGAARATSGNPSASNSQYFDDVSSSTFTAVRGYIITGGNNGADSLDFVAANNTQLTFCNGGYTPENYNPVVNCNSGWCLVGTPYVSAYNLYYADRYKTYYVAPSYTPVTTSADYKLNAFGAFFMQATANTPIDYDETGLTTFAHPNPAPRYSMLNINIANEKYSDVSEIQLTEDANLNYLLGEDALKIQIISALSPQIYTSAEGACSGLSINTLPINTNRVDLITKITSVGQHTIQLNDKEKLNNIVSAKLVDTETGIQTDLVSDGKYTFDANTTGTSNRFYILMSTNSSTGINQNGNNDIKVTINGIQISLSELNGEASVRLYDVVGKQMYQYNDLQNGQSFDVSVPGVYLMDISTQTQNKRVKVLIQDK